MLRAQPLLHPVEVLGAKAPLRIEHYGYCPDSGGAGQHRGGVGVSRVYRFLKPSSAISILYKTSSPWGIGEGRPADPNHIVLNPGTEREKRQGGSYNVLEANQILANNTGVGRVGKLNASGPVTDGQGCSHRVRLARVCPPRLRSGGRSRHLRLDEEPRG